MERFFERFFRSIRFDASWMQVNSTLGIEDTRAMILGANKNDAIPKNVFRVHLLSHAK